MNAADDSASASDCIATGVGWLLAVAAIAIMLGYVPSLSAPFVAPKLAVLELAGALGLLGWSIGSRRPRWNRGVAGAAAAFGLVLVISAALALHRGPAGAPYASTEMMRFAALGGVAIGAGFAARAESANARRLTEAIHASAGLVALLGLGQHLRFMPLRIPTISVPGSTFGNRNIAAEAVAMAIPFGLGLIRSRESLAPPAPPPSARQELQAFSSAAFLLAEIAYLAVARARGAWLGGALGIAIFFVLRRPRPTRGTIYAVLATALLAILAAAIPGRWTARDAHDSKRFAPAAQVVHDAVDPTSPVARTRLGLWRRTLEIYRSHPLAGVGPGNFAVAFPLYAEPNATADGVLSPVAVPRRAHNDLLERLAESGLPGLAALLALYVALGAVAIRRVREARRDGRPDDAARDAACAGSLAAFVGCGLTGFPFGMPATVFLFGVAAGILAAGAPAPAAPTGPRGRAPARIAIGAGAAGLGLVFVLFFAVVYVVFVGRWSVARLEASYFIARADGARAGDDSPADAARALSFLRRAERATPNDFQVALRTSSAALRAGRADDAIAAAERALAVEPASANAWEALARARLATNDAPGAAVAADHALGILHDYPGALVTRAQAAGRLGDAGAAAGARSRLSALAVTDDDARRLLATLASPAR
jgi:O-antigen ligase